MYIASVARSSAIVIVLRATSDAGRVNAIANGIGDGKGPGMAYHFDSKGSIRKIRSFIRT